MRQQVRSGPATWLALRVLYLHCLGVLNQNGPKLPIEFKENLPLASPVQITHCQGFDVQCLAPFQFHLQKR